MADGHGGIQTIAKTSTSGLVDTYTITFSDETTSTFTVTNARSISNLTSSKSGKVTTVTITYNDSTTSSFTVRDGENVTSITEYWAISTSGSSQPQSGWQTTPPTMTSTYKYLWHYTLYTYSDGTTSSTTPAVQGVYGDKGDTGNTGTSITSIAKTSTSGLVDTYTVTMSNGTTTTFTVTNGSEIVSIAKTSTAGLVDTYTVTMGSGDTHTFTVTNGRGIISFEQTSGTHAAGTIDVYTITYNDGDTSQIQVYNGANGTGAVSTVAGIGVSGSSGDVPLIIKGYGAPTTATVGQENQLYFDMTGGIMYICIAISGSTYDWRGMSSAVDSAMSTTSANPLQNRVISNKVGVGSLASGFSATNLTDAANELMTNKAEKSAAVSTVTYDSTNHKLTKTINGTTSDVMTVDTTPTDGSMNPITSDAAYDLNGAIQKNNISQTIFKDANAILTNCNDAFFGTNGYDPNTSNAPTTAKSKWGILHQFQSNNWIWQIAISTYGEEYTRCNINNNGWSAWNKSVKEDDLVYTTFTATTTSQKISSLFGYVERGFVVIQVEFAAGLAAGWHNDISTSIPAEYRPRHQMYGTFRRNSGNDFNINAYGVIHAGGNFQLGLSATNAASLPFEFMYPIKT